MLTVTFLELILNLLMIDSVSLLFLMDLKEVCGKMN